MSLRMKRHLMAAGNTFCPLCMEPLTDDTATAEHAPPRSVYRAHRGRASHPHVCLTCSRCNHAARGIESRMAEWESRVEDGVRCGPIRDDNPLSWRMVFPVVTDHPLMRGWAKTCLILAGTASDGDAWRESWSDPLREYIRSRDDAGDTPACMLYLNRADRVTEYVPEVSYMGMPHGNGYLVSWGCHAMILACGQSVEAARSDFRFPDGKGTGQWDEYGLLWTRRGPFQYGRERRRVWEENVRQMIQIYTARFGLMTSEYPH